VIEKRLAAQRAAANDDDLDAAIERRLAAQARSPSPEEDLDDVIERRLAAQRARQEQLELQEKLDKQQRELELLAQQQVEEEEVDPLEAFMAANNKKAKKDLSKAKKAELEDKQAVLQGKELTHKAERGRMDHEEESVKDAMQAYKHELKVTEVCMNCEEKGHNARDCPKIICAVCKEVGHKRAQCPTYTKQLKEEAKIKKIEKQKHAKKMRKAAEWNEEMRKRSGVDGFAALYKVLGLDTRRLASLQSIKDAYKKMSLIWHPDKNPNNLEVANQKFLKIKAAYEILEEGIRTGGKGMKGAVYSSGDLMSPEDAAKAVAEAAAKAAALAKK